jgi:2,5-diamino-6-(ribosylamino)-4(3H)-pyrimidinone 5'-phosphate reductase
MPMRPRVVIYDAVSVDGSIEGFEPDVGLFYKIAGRIGEDCTLAGCDTLLASEPDAEGAPPLAQRQDGDSRPLMAVVDSRGRFRGYRNVLAFGVWRGAVALCAAATPLEHLDYLRSAGVEIAVIGADRVDLPAALEWLAADHAVQLVRVESGGLLNGALAQRGLVDEVHLLIHPVLAGSGRSFYRPKDGHVLPLKLLSSEEQEHGALYVRWEVVREA